MRATTGISRRTPRFVYQLSNQSTVIFIVLQNYLLQRNMDHLPSLSAGVAPSTGPLRYIVLDHVQILAGQELLTALSRLRELTGTLLNSKTAAAVHSELHTRFCIQTADSWMQTWDTCAFPGANVEVLMISQAPWGCELYENDALAMTPPKEIHFPAYEISELEEVGRPTDAPPLAY